MKKVNEILNTVKRRPYFKDVHKYSCFNKLLALMPPRFAKAIAFFYIKNNTLFGALSHPGYKMELNYNKDLINNLLNQLIIIDLDCAEIFKDVKKIEFFVSKFHTPAPYIAPKTDIKYKELSSGNFTINAKDSDIYGLLKKIQEDIIINNERD
jgi:hypothetical protein